MKGRYWIGILLLTLMAGCQANGSSEKDKEKAKEATVPESGVKVERAVLMPHAPYPATAPTASPAQGPHPSPRGSRLESLGIEVDPGRIIIDTGKAREVLKNLSRQFRQEIAPQHTPGSSSQVSVPKLGIEVSDKKVEIDLNRTKNFLEKWIGVIQTLTQEVNRSLAPLR
jgi:hypothetical protein